MCSAPINQKAVGGPHEWGEEFVRRIVTWTEFFDERGEIASPFRKGVISGIEHFNAVGRKTYLPGETKAEVSGWDWTLQWGRNPPIPQ